MLLDLVTKCLSEEASMLLDNNVFWKIFLQIYFNIIGLLFNYIFYLRIYKHFEKNVIGLIRLLRELMEQNGQEHPKQLFPTLLDLTFPFLKNWGGIHITYN